MTRRELRTRIERAIDVWDDRCYDRDWHERWYVPEVGFLSAIFRRTCQVVGHVIVDDHCGLVEHRYCEVCYSRPLCS